MSDHPNSVAGKTFGRLKAVSYYDVCANGSRWSCLCSCGKSSVVSRCHLVSGRTRSCGCLQREEAAKNKTHGMHGTRVYRTWSRMISRCRTTHGRDAKNYTQRGIRVCKRWHKFENFLADMGEPMGGMSIDRKDNDGNYCKRNCRWATAIQQANNTRGNRNITAFGETKSVSDWARDSRCPVAYKTLRSRVLRGWPDKIAITATKKHRRDSA